MVSPFFTRLWYQAKTGFRIPAGPVTVDVRARRTPSMSHRRYVAAHAHDGTATPATDALPGTSSSPANRPDAPSPTGTVLIVGAGPGLGTALALHFSSQQMRVALAARNTERLAPLVQSIAESGGTAGAFPCDACSESAVNGLLREVERELVEPPELVIYNCEGSGPGGILDITPHAFEDAWRVNCFGAFLVSRAVLPAMLKHGRGTIVFTGPTGALRGRAGYANLAVGKSGARMLAQSMAREFGPRGIHVAHVVIDGPVHTPANADHEFEQGPQRLIQPHAIAATIGHLHRQHPSCWTHELDLRSCVEPF